MLRNLATRVALILAVAVTAAPAAHAADQTIHGRQLVVKNPSTPDRRQLVVKAKEIGSPDTIVGDPTAAGASLSITVDGGTPSMQTFALPAGTSALTGKPFWSGDTVKGFKYKDAKGENGPVKVAQLKKSGGAVFQIKAHAVGQLGAITVVPPNPGTDGCVRLGIGGGGDTYDLRFADGQVTNDGAKQFKVLNPVTEGSCLPPPPPCGGAAPICNNGPCPDGTSCASVPVVGGFLCSCAPTTTCEGSAPACNGTCPDGTSCGGVDVLGMAQCGCARPPLCGDTAPQCGGNCPLGGCRQVGAGCGCVFQIF
jgi:hypothetical protein